MAPVPTRAFRSPAIEGYQPSLCSRIRWRDRRRRQQAVLRDFDRPMSAVGRGCVKTQSVLLVGGVRGDLDGIGGSAQPIRQNRSVQMPNGSLRRGTQAPIHDFIVPKGCSTVWRRTRILSGFRSSRACTVSSTASCSQRVIRRSRPVVHLLFSAHA
jgi:hypothetical protein